MRYAIKPRGIGKKPGARAIENAGALADGETFTVQEAGYSPALVLSEDGVSLRAKTPEELTAEAAAAAAAVVEQDGQTALALDARADAIFDQLKNATTAQISTFVNNRFVTLTAPERNVMKLVLQCCALFLRRGSG